LPVTAQQLTPDQSRCLNRGKEFSLDMQISGCTAVLQSDLTSVRRNTTARSPTSRRRVSPLT
jgi:hypothetical protein